MAGMMQRRQWFMAEHGHQRVFPILDGVVCSRRTSHEGKGGEPAPPGCHHVPRSGEPAHRAGASTASRGSLGCRGVVAMQQLLRPSPAPRRGCGDAYVADVGAIAPDLARAAGHYRLGLASCHCHRGRGICWTMVAGRARTFKSSKIRDLHR